MVGWLTIHVSCFMCIDQNFVTIVAWCKISLFIHINCNTTQMNLSCASDFVLEISQLLIHLSGEVGTGTV